MFHLLYKEYFNKNTRHIFVISVIVFVVLNIIIEINKIDLNSLTMHIRALIPKQQRR